MYGSLDEVNTRNSTIIHNSTLVDNPDYCDHLTYWLAFWLITLVYVALLVTIVAGLATVGALRRSYNGVQGEETPIVERGQ